MRGLAAGVLLTLVAVAAWLWGFGGAAHVSAWAAETQRDVQNAMAGSLRALRAGETGALTGLWLLCLTYGFVHAAGPGHGKMVIGGYGLGVRVPVRRLVGLAGLSSLAQAVMAVVFVTVALAILGWGREQLTDLADRTMAPLSYGLIAALGAWLAFRGVRKLWRLRGARGHQHAHDHDHSHEDGACSVCGHAHAPTLEQAAAVRSWKDVFAVVAAIAIRPCTGAVFLLILTYAFGIYWVGIVGVLIMGAGTAGLTMLVAFAAVGARESMLAQTASSTGVAWLIGAAEVLAGCVVVLLASQLLLRVV